MKTSDRETVVVQNWSLHKSKKKETWVMKGFPQPNYKVVSAGMEYIDLEGGYIDATDTIKVKEVVGEKVEIKEVVVRRRYILGDMRPGYKDFLKAEGFKLEDVVAKINAALDGGPDEAA